tara:strand:+ start:316 stop:564 length:249 start_codon:yes stop_codon:yes gene_type:complete
MALEKVVTQDKIEIVGDHRAIQIRTRTSIQEDGVEISANFHRHVIMPGEDYSSESVEVRAVCTAIHTDSVVSAYQAYVDTLV